MPAEEIEPQSLDANKSPEVTAQSAAGQVGEAAVETTATQIPVKGPEGDRDPATQQWRAENWVDEDKARPMAIAGDEDRTYEAGGRQRKKQYLEDVPFEEQIKTDPRTYEEGQFGKRLTQWAEDEIGEKRKVADTKSKQLTEDEINSDTVSGENARDRASFEEWRRREAEQKERWAGILYDHPVSESYEKTHQRIDFTNIYGLYNYSKFFSFNPEGLAHLENDVDFGTKEIKFIEETLIPRIPLISGAAGLSTGYVEALGKEFGFRNPIDAPSHLQVLTLDHLMASAYRDKDRDHEQLQEYEMLINNPKTTLEQLHELFVKTFRVAVVQRLRDRVDAKASILEDIKSGRASQPAISGQAAA